MINLNLNFSIKPEALGTSESRGLLIDSLLAFQHEAKQKGLSLSVNAPSVPRSISSNASTVEHGPFEKQWLAQSGKSRMKVPSTWQGSREDYALEKLNGPAYFNDSTDDNETEEHEESGDIFDRVI